VDTLVFREKKYSLKELTEAADGNFENSLDVLKACKNAPKFGSDNQLADSHALRLMTSLLDLIDKEATNSQGIRDVITLNVTINDSNHLEDGEALGATVDGRRKGEPLSENLSPVVGRPHDVTSLLSSVSKLPFDRIHSGALNLRLSRSLASSENAEEYIKALMKTYFDKGGMQLQFSIVDTNELYAAQKNPEKYSDLLVRITGYSAVFVDMCRGAQDEFIRREELK
jgi:formate C-acetyltransferase